MQNRWTDSQRRAIETHGDVCVAAGAGSGKTGVLVQRFIRILTDERSRGDRAITPDNILVITFTEKATKEMKARIVEELNRLGMTSERRLVEAAYISTIHGFCSRLLQENPFEAGVDPQFTVLDEAQARRLQRQAFDQTIQSGYAARDPEVTELIAAAQAGTVAGEHPAEPLTMLANNVETLLAAVRGAGTTWDEANAHWLSGMRATYDASLGPVRSIVGPLVDEIRACILGIRALTAGALGATEAAVETLASLLPALTSEVDDLTDAVQAIETAQKTVGRLRLRVMGASGRDAELSSLAERIRIACRAAESLFKTRAAQEEDAALICHRMWGLVVAVWRAYDAAKRERGALDTEDLQAECVRLLQTSAAVRRRYQRRFRHLLVDEFQDTNPLQMRLIKLLHVPAAATQTANADDPIPNSLFVVGDVQQSIYGFRNADSALFRDLAAEYRAGRRGAYVPLTVNFRSRPEILALIAAIFERVWHGGSIDFAPLTAGAEFDRKPGPSVETLLTKDLYRRDYVPLEARCLAARIRTLVESHELTITSRLDPRCGEPVGYRDIAVLFRSLGDVERYEESFARAGVPYFVVGGGRGYYARHEVRDLLNVVTVLESPLDDLALAATLRSPFVGADVETLYRLSLAARIEETEATSVRHTSHKIPLVAAIPRLLQSGLLPPDEQARLEAFVRAIEQLRTLEDRIPIGRLLERLIACTHYDARLLCRPGGRRRLANVRKLLQIANTESVVGARGFIQRLKDISVLSDREGDAPTEEEAADVVRFLTIHSAKGLEFPVVVLADLSRGLLRPERGAFLCSRRELALGARIHGEPSIAYRAIDQRRQDEDKEESERLLYVAMTRAREHLILCANAGRSRSFNWGENLLPLLGLLEPPPEPVIQILPGGVAARIAPMNYALASSA